MPDTVAVELLLVEATIKMARVEGGKVLVSQLSQAREKLDVAERQLGAAIDVQAATIAIEKYAKVIVSALDGASLAKAVNNGSVARSKAKVSVDTAYGRMMALEADCGALMRSFTVCPLTLRPIKPGCLEG